jgi:hypothetical protein
MKPSLKNIFGLRRARNGSMSMRSARNGSVSNRSSVTRNGSMPRRLSTRATLRHYMRALGNNNTTRNNNRK